LYSMLIKGCCGEWGKKESKARIPIAYIKRVISMSPKLAMKTRMKIPP
jgi:hypothetical protein